MSEYGNSTIKSLLGEALRESGDLAQKEFTLFRTEMSQNVRSMMVGAGMMVAAAVFAVAALTLFTEALVDWLATVLRFPCSCGPDRRRRHGADRPRVDPVRSARVFSSVSYADEDCSLGQARRRSFI